MESSKKDKKLLGKRRKREELQKKEEENQNKEIYHFKDNLRFVNPYWHEFQCFTKRRWIDQKLLTIYSNEFKAFSIDYYERAIMNHNVVGEFKSQITVNGKNINLDYVLKDGDRILHRTYREETPIYAQLPLVLKETDEYVVVSKPSSMPVHACGNFKYNTLQGILENEMGYKNKIKTVHRLDRQTSGIVFFAKNEKASNTFREMLLSCQVSKVYYARVQGDFRKCKESKDGEVNVCNLMYCVSNIDAYWECSDCADLTKVKFEYRHLAKEAVTKFEHEFYDEASDTSVIRCYPKTGRTHQLRVHLKWLGYPIANDQMYCTQNVIHNDGGIPLDEALFKNSYQNDQQDGKKNFLKLWLHAFKYTLPESMALSIENPKPDWAQEEYKIDKSQNKTEQKTNNTQKPEGIPENMRNQKLSNGEKKEENVEEEVIEPKITKVLKKD